MRPLTNPLLTSLLSADNIQRECYPGEWPCPSSGLCIPMDHLCDGTPHCPNGEDESNATAGGRNCSQCRRKRRAALVGTCESSPSPRFHPSLYVAQVSGGAPLSAASTAAKPPPTEEPALVRWGTSSAATTVAHAQVFAQCQHREEQNKEY